jgi:hypothetical protein
VIDGCGIFSELDYSIRCAFKAGQEKHTKYMKDLLKNAMIYAAHALDPRYKTSMIKDIMEDRAETAITAIKKYFKREWPKLAVEDVLATLSLANSNVRPTGISLAL